MARWNAIEFRVIHRNINFQDMFVEPEEILFQQQNSGYPYFEYQKDKFLSYLHAVVMCI